MKIENLGIELTDFDFSKYPLPSFVYFLINNGDCVYIGISKYDRIFGRLDNHIRGNKVFNSIKILQLRTSWNTLEIEKLLIRQFAPIYNKQSTHLPPQKYEQFKQQLKNLIKGNEDFVNQLKNI